jgi:branched-chain amino acid transport system ATP-binding protein
MAKSAKQQPGQNDLLVCRNVSAGWGETQVLSDISFSVPQGETLAVLGRNGVGKTTLLSTIAGRATLRSGDIHHDGQSLGRMPKYQRALRGIGLVPQEREIFSSLSVQENLTVAAQKRNGAGDGWSVDRVYNLFPRLKERRNNYGNQLSGGEQQMLSIGRALMGNPSLLLLDEPMEGLAPVIVDQLIKALHQIRAETRLTILLVEQHVSIATEFTNRLIVLDRGVIVYDNADGMAPHDQARIEQLIGIDAG